MTKGSCRANELCTWRMMSELLIARPLSCLGGWVDGWLVGWKGECEGRKVGQPTDIHTTPARTKPKARTSGGNWLVKDLNSLSVEPISTSPGALSRMESSACVAHALVITCIARRSVGIKDWDERRAFYDLAIPIELVLCLPGWRRRGRAPRGSRSRGGGPPPVLVNVGSRVSTEPQGIEPPPPTTPTSRRTDFHLKRKMRP